MIRECVFKCCARGKWWYLYQYPYEKAPEGYFYRVYLRRKWYDQISWFEYEAALSRLLDSCLGSNSVKLGEDEL